MIDRLNIKDLIKDNFKKVLQTGEAVMLIQGKPGYNTVIDKDGMVSFEKQECLYDPNGTVKITYDK